MGPRQSGRRDEIVAAALSLLEEQGPDAVTMRSIAQRLGIQAPSLYKHVADKGELEAALIIEGLRDWAEQFGAALQSSRDPLLDVAQAYRAWALRRPHLYRLMTDKPLPRAELPAGLEAAAAAPVVSAVGGDENLARVAWALAHGLASLEIADRFPPGADLDAAWRTAVSALHGARPHARTPRSRKARR
jgi:AcrR family transcriptional regulator